MRWVRRVLIHGVLLPAIWPFSAIQPCRPTMRFNKKITNSLPQWGAGEDDE